jgi:hypothetical protein
MRNRPLLWRNSSWFLHHGSAPANVSLLIRDFLANTTELCFLSHPINLTSLRQTYDNAPAHVSLLIRDFLANTTELCFLSHPTDLTWLQQTFSYFPN